RVQALLLALLLLGGLVFAVRVPVGHHPAVPFQRRGSGRRRGRVGFDALVDESEAPAVVVGGAGDVLVRLEPGEREGLPAGLEALACQPVRGPRFVELCAVAVVAVGERGPPVVEVAAESLAGTGGAVPARR